MSFAAEAILFAKVSKQWTKPVKKTVIMKNKVEDGSMEDIIVVILKNVICCIILIETIIIYGKI